MPARYVRGTSTTKVRKAPKRPISVSSNRSVSFSSVSAKPSRPAPPAPAPSAPLKAKKRVTRVRKVEQARKAIRQGRKALPGLDAEQTKVAAKVLDQGLKAGASKKELLSSVETGLVESTLRNLDYGDLDSKGWRQERSSIYGTGPKGPTNVKQSARRYFQESATEGSRGKGMTAGQLAQTVQGSAFPERYDEVKAQAKPIVKAYVKGQVTKTKQKPGAWAGSKRAVLDVVPKATRPEGKSDKRSPTENSSVGGSATSDHLTTNKLAYAADLPADDEVAKRIAKRLGLPSHTGTQEVIKDGYRYQLIWQDAGHYDHIHLGATWVGAGVPPTVAGAASGTATATTTSSPLALPTGSAKTAKRRKAKKATGEKRSALIRELIAEGPAVSPTISSPPEADLIAEEVALGL